MFENLSDKLSGAFDRLRGRGRLDEADVNEALREVRLAMLDADVADFHVNLIEFAKRRRPVLHNV